MIQTVIVLVIVGAAAWLLVRSLRRRSGGDCGCGCDDCPVRRDCSSKELRK